MSLKEFYCSECHFHYLAEEYDLEHHKKLHKQYHDKFIYGIKINSWKSDNVIYEKKDFKVILISPNSPLAQCKRAEVIALHIKKESKYDFSAYSSGESSSPKFPLVFIGITENRAITFLVLRLTEKTANVKLDYYFDPKRTEIIPLYSDTRWGISMIWVLKNKRRMGYAKKIIEVATDYTDLSLNEIAWFLPFSESGYLFAKKITQNDVILTTNKFSLSVA